MTKTRHIPDFIWRWMRPFNRRLAQNFGPQSGMSDMVLLLTTTGRKSRLPRVTPLQFEEESGVFYIASARGTQADWFRNILSDPNVEVQVRGRRFRALAEPVTDPGRIADFLTMRLERHPRMVGTLLRAEGLPRNFTRPDLEHFSAEKALVILHPCEGEI